LTMDEYEVVTMSDVQAIIADCTTIDFEQTEIDILKDVFKTKRFEGFVIFEELQRALVAFGMVVDLPQPRKHLNYASLNLKSIRILNRLVAYLEKNNSTLDAFLDGLLIQ
jgi:hypothetical protein